MLSPRRTWTRGAAAALLLGAVACAPSVSLRVPPAAVAELPLERRLTLLDAENDLLARVDARDAQEERVLRARAAVREAKRREGEARSGSGAAGDAAEKEAAARVEHAERDEEWQEAELRAADAALLVAEAQYELARATEVDSAALPGAQGVQPAKFREQVEQLRVIAADKAQAAARARAEADKATARWTAARTDLTRLTGGSQGSAWVQ